MNITRGWEIANEQFKIYKEQNDKLLKSHFVSLVSKMEEEVNKNFVQPVVSRQLPSVYDLDIQALRNTPSDAEFIKKIQQWLEGNFG